MSHAVARLRAERLARSLKPFVSRGSRSERCPDCRVIPAYCLCAWRPRVEARAAMSLTVVRSYPCSENSSSAAVRMTARVRSDLGVRLRVLLGDLGIRA